jgi:hypothetical protein
MTSDLHDWEYGKALAALEVWAETWLAEETQDAYVVGPADLQASAAKRIADTAVRMGWWQDVDGAWHKPVPSRF